MLVIVPVIILLTLLVFLPRALPGLLAVFDDERTYIGVNDSYNIRNIIQTIRENGHRLPYPYPNLLPTKPIGYPILMHWLLSFVPTRVVNRIVPYWGAIIESLHAGFLMIVAYWLITETSFGQQIPPVEGVFLVGLVFALSPILIKGKTGPGFIFSARSFGSLCLTGCLVCLLSWQYTGRPVYLGLSGLLLGATFLSHKFATQVAWFLLPALSVTTGEPVYVLVLLGSLLLAVTVSSGFYARALQGHLAHVRYWMLLQFLPKWGLEVNRAAVRLAEQESLADAIQPLLPSSYRWFWRSELTFPYAYTPFVIIPVVAAVTGQVDDTTLVLFVWFTALAFAHLIVTLPSLRYIGSPGRYYQYAVSPIALLTAHSVYNLDLGVRPIQQISLGTVLVLAVVPYAALLSVRELRIACRALTSTDPDQSTEPLLEWLQSQDPKRIVFVPSYLCKHFVPFTDHQFLFPRTTDHTSTAKRKQIAETQEYTTAPNPDLNRLGELYELDYVVFETAFLTESAVEYELPESEPVYTDDRFSVYRIGRGEQT